MARSAGLKIITALALAGAMGATPALAQQKRASLGPSVAGGPALEFGFHHVAFTVPDIDASIAWYGKVLGFKVLEEALLGGKTRGVQLINGSLHIELFQGDPGATAPTVTNNSVLGVKHPGFVVKDIDAFVAEVKARGAKVEVVMHSKANPRADLAFISDNAGNRLEFIQPLTGDPPF